MKRLLISTTALSVALTQVAPMPLMAQTVTENGSIIADDGRVLCEATAEAPCDLNAVMEQLAAEAAAAEAEAAAAAQAEAEAAAAAQAEAEAAAAAQAEAEAAAAAQAEADAAAAAQAEAEAAAAAQAEAEAAAAAQAEAEAAAAAQAEAEAAAAAQAEAEAAAAAQAEAEAAAAEEAATEEPSLGEAMEEILTEEPVVEDAAPEEVIVEEAPADAAPAEGVVTEEAPVEEVAPEATLAEEAPATEVAPDAAPAEDGVIEEAAPEATVTEAPAEEAASEAAPAEQVAPVAVEAVTDPAVLVDPAATEAPPAEAVETLSELLAQPEGLAPEALEAAATLAPVEVTEGEPVEIAPAADATDVLVQQITEENARSSAQDFAAPASATLAAATAAAAPEDRGLTDLQKFGLVALGALAVGAIINANRDQVVSNTGDRVVVQRGNGDYYIYKDDDTLLRRPGSTVRTESFRDGSTRTIVERADGTQVVTIRDATGRVLRRATYDGLGREIVLIDDLYPEERIDVRTLPQPRGRVISLSTSEEDALLRARMAALDAEELGRTFSLRQIREVPQVRQLAATVDVNNITFDTGSAAIQATQAESLAALGRLMTSMIRENPNEIFLIEGHTDAVGSASLNLTLSDRRAESVALALTEYFDVPPENMVVQGYGESDLRVNTQEAERQNRRVAVRIITPLLRTAAR